MARVLSTAFVLTLLAATAVAFALTERAKIERSPIAGTAVDPPLFSPTSATQSVTHVKFRLRTRERLEVWIQDGSGDRIRTLLPTRTEPRGARLDLVWDGLSEAGTVAPDGVYVPVVKLPHRTFVLPSGIRIDTRPPVIKVRHPQYPLLSPDGDGRRDSFVVPYRVSEPAHAILLVRGQQVVFTRSQKLTGTVAWNGKIGTRPARPGRYVLSIAAEDRAGNRSKGYPFAIAQVRYVVLARDRVVVRPGASFALRVSTDHPTVTWTLHGRSGTERSGTLHFRAPRSVGVYRLYVYAAGHAAKCTVVVV